MDFSKWDFKECIHKLGRVTVVMGMSFGEEATAIILVKPMVFLTAPIEMIEGDFVLLG